MREGLPGGLDCVAVCAAGSRTGAVRCVSLAGVSTLLRRRRWQRPKKNKGLGAGFRTVREGRYPRVLSEDKQTAWPNGQVEIRGVARPEYTRIRACRDTVETRRRCWRRRRATSDVQVEVEVDADAVDLGTLYARRRWSQRRSSAAKLDAAAA